MATFANRDHYAMRIRWKDAYGSSPTWGLEKGVPLTAYPKAPPMLYAWRTGTDAITDDELARHGVDFGPTSELIFGDLKGRVP